MNQLLQDRVEVIRGKLNEIFETIRGNFSIEQMILRDHTVLLKIYQQEDGRKPSIAFGLVIDRRSRIGYCHEGLLRRGENLTLVKRTYTFDPVTFDNWICCFRPLRHLKRNLKVAA